MPESVPQTLIYAAPKSFRLNGLHPELLKCLKNDKSKISRFLDENPTAWKGMKPDKCGLKSRLTHLYSAIIQEPEFQFTHLIPYFNIHWNIDTNLIRKKIKENVNKNDWPRMRIVNAMERGDTSVYSSNGESIQLHFSHWFNAIYEDHRKIISDIVNIYSTIHRKALISSEKNISFTPVTISEINQKLPKYSRNEILHVLKSHNDIFSNDSHQSSKEEKWFIICKVEKIQAKIKLIPRSLHSYVTELEKNTMGNAKKLRLDQERRKKNYSVYRLSWNDHERFYSYFNEHKPIGEEKSLKNRHQTYNKFIVYLMNLVWQYYSEAAKDLHDTRPPVKKLRFLGVGGNGRAWHHLVVARAITKLNRKQRKMFFKINSNDEKFNKKFNNGKSDERWKDFESNVPKKQLKERTKESITRNLICSNENCDSTEFFRETSIFDICKKCGDENPYNIDHKEKGNPRQLYEIKHKNRWFNSQHRYIHFQQFSKERKIEKWKKYLSRDQKEFLNNLSCDILMNAEDEVKGLMKLVQELNWEAEIDKSSENEGINCAKSVQKFSAESVMNESSVDDISKSSSQLYHKINKDSPHKFPTLKEVDSDSFYNQKEEE